MSALDSAEPSWEVTVTPRSSHIDEFRFDKTTDTLEIDFQDGSTYVYYNLSPATHRAFQSAPSAGQFFDRVIKGRYSYELR